MSSLGFASASAAFGVHRDVLEANPSTDSERLSLLEELKRRGRAAVASKAYPDAKALYSKAIEIFPENSNDRDKAILYSNRSLCEFQMNKSENARDDAEMATVLDPTYVKGFWRLGSAHAVRPNETSQALQAYQSALALEPKNVALQKEVQKLEKRLEKEEEIYIKANQLILKVVENILEENKYLTPDLGGNSSTKKLTDHIIERIENHE